MAVAALQAAALLLTLASYVVAFPSDWAQPSDGAATPDCVSHPTAKMGLHDAPTPDPKLEVAVLTLTADRTDAICPGHSYKVQASWQNATVAAMITGSCEGKPCGTFFNTADSTGLTSIKPDLNCVNRVLIQMTTESFESSFNVSCAATGALEIRVTSVDASNAPGLGFQTGAAKFPVAVDCAASVCSGSLISEGSEFSEASEASNAFEFSSALLPPPSPSPQPWLTSPPLPPSPSNVDTPSSPPPPPPAPPPPPTSTTTSNSPLPTSPGTRVVPPIPSSPFTPRSPRTPVALLDLPSPAPPPDSPNRPFDPNWTPETPPPPDFPAQPLADIEKQLFFPATPQPSPTPSPLPSPAPSPVPSPVPSPIPFPVPSPVPSPFPSPAMPTTFVRSTDEDKKSGASSAVIGGAVAGGCILLVLLVVCACIWRRSSRADEYKLGTAVPAPVSGLAKDGKHSGLDDGIDTTGFQSCMTGASTGFVPESAKGDYLLQASVAAFKCAAFQPTPRTVHVEGDINDWKLDSLCSNNSQASTSGAVGTDTATASLHTSTRLTVTTPRLQSAQSSTMCPVLELTSEQVLDQLVLLPGEVLGRGATAVVMKCMWAKRFGPDAVLAAKVLKNPYEAEQVILQSFCYEATLLASVRHPNVVRLYGYCLEPPTICLVLELVPCTLKNRIYARTLPPPLPSSTHRTATSAATTTTTIVTTTTTNTNTASVITTVISDEHSLDQHPSSLSPRSARSTQTSVGGAATDGSKAQAKASTGIQSQKLSMAEVLQISTDIAAGLAFLHETTITSHSGRHQVAINIDSPDEGEQGGAFAHEDGRRIVHRDLKPANILMNSLGRSKLSDFGLARRHQSTTVHTVHQAAGTIPYMAPELLAARGSHGSMISPTNRVDIYSFAMLMWELLAGQVPYAGMTELQILSYVSNNRRPQLPRAPKFRPQQDQGAGVSAGEGLDTSAPASQVPVDQHPPTPDLAALPASLDALPEFNEIIAACWAQRELRRPTAATVYRMLRDLAAQFHPSTTNA